MGEALALCQEQEAALERLQRQNMRACKWGALLRTPALATFCEMALTWLQRQLMSGARHLLSQLTTLEDSTLKYYCGPHRAQ